MLGRAVREDAVEGKGVVVLGIGEFGPRDLQLQRVVGQRKIGQRLVAGLQGLQTREDLEVFLDHANEFI